MLTALQPCRPVTPVRPEPAKVVLGASVFVCMHRCSCSTAPATHAAQVHRLPRCTARPRPCCPPRELQEQVKSLQAELKAAQAAADLEATLREFRQFLENGGPAATRFLAWLCRDSSLRSCPLKHCSKRGCSARSRALSHGGRGWQSPPAPRPTSPSRRAAPRRLAQASTTTPRGAWSSCGRSWLTRAPRNLRVQPSSSSSSSSTTTAISHHSSSSSRSMTSRR
jgi:hypothetical protein